MIAMERMVKETVWLITEEGTAHRVTSFQEMQPESKDIFTYKPSDAQQSAVPCKREKKKSEAQDLLIQNWFSFFLLA